VQPQVIRLLVFLLLAKGVFVVVAILLQQHVANIHIQVGQTQQQPLLLGL
jgi:hypothetical protein